MRLDRAWIEAHIPHQGRMCLLDEVAEWSSQRIVCLTRTHLEQGNPLRGGGRLGAACAIEYAAQVMAVHGALCASASPAEPRPTAGFLAGVRGVSLHVEWLDDVDGALNCAAVRTAGDVGSALYEFEIRGSKRLLVAGRATVILGHKGRFTA